MRGRRSASKTGLGVGLPLFALLSDLDLLATPGSRETGKAGVFRYLNTGQRQHVLTPHEEARAPVT